MRTPFSGAWRALARRFRNIRGAWIKEQHVRCDDGRVTEYQVNCGDLRT
ncbi:MAG: dodecin domain-containing protein [Acidobacteria bacterium]|nr:dodecin domain-containing protein [Acidobacteriota bacterium]